MHILEVFAHAGLIVLGIYVCAFPVVFLFELRDLQRPVR